MKTYLSDDHPVWSLLFAGVYLALGTQNFYFLSTGILGGGELSTLLWVFFGLASYGFALYALRNGISNRSERLMKLFEPRWLAENRE